MEEKQIYNFIDKSTLNDCTNAFLHTTGLSIDIIDENGDSVINLEGKNYNCQFCKIIKESETGCKKCKDFHKKIGIISSKKKKSYISRCHAGLVEIATPILIKGKHVGSILCGSGVMWETDDVFLEEVLDNCSSYIDDFTPLYECSKKIPYFSKEKAHSLSTLLYMMSNYIVNVGWMRFMKLKDIQLSQTTLYDTVYNHNDEGHQAPRYGHIYNRVDISNIIDQSNEKQNEYFQKKMSEVISLSQGDIVILRKYVLDFIEVLKKAFSEMGVYIMDDVSYSDTMMKDLYLANTEYEIILVASSIFNRFCTNINTSKKIKRSNSANLMVRYIQKNFMNDISLDDLANSTGLNPSYACRHFKENLGINFSEYLLKVRLENAKSLLVKTNYNVSQIAYSVGFQDPAYFTKKFRLYEGITPSEFREKQSEK